MPRKILVANRGEIAIRVIRACDELRVKSVSVYSDEDERSLFHRLASERVNLKGDDARDTYLNIEKIIAAAKDTGCDAIHPGYGFLSENADFVEACEKAGVTFIGPSAAVMRRVADKSSVKEIMRGAGIPVLPSIENEADPEKVKTFAAKVGYPLIVKPSFGGGGKGMKIVRSEADIADAVASARGMGDKAFGNAAFYIEKFLEDPHHIEVQILVDCRGRIIDLGERECSIQRRHQKLIEETPSPTLNDDERRRVADYAKKAAAAVGYENAGTMEFLYQDGEFYFLEVNARLQVEHTITELVTGIDLVKEQIRIAEGCRFESEMENYHIDGHAIQCRINAEDPFNHFMPSPGQLTGYRSPGGIGVRVDSGVFMKFSIPAQYDSLVSKLSVWGRDRNEATARMKRALKEYVILGIATTLPLYRAIFREEDFLAGRYTTRYLKTHFPRLVEILKERHKAMKGHDELLAHIFQPEYTILPVWDGHAEFEE